MVSETTIKRICGPAALNRAHVIVARGNLVRNRECAYEGRHTRLRARFKGLTEAEDPCEAQVVIDERLGDVISTSCDCPDGARGNTCKHAVALMLDFARYDFAYDGYDPSHFVTTSDCITAYMNRHDEDEWMDDGPSTTREGSIWLRLTLSRDDTGWTAGFRVEGESASYVIRSIGEFLGHLEAQDYHEYGKHLAFTHTTSVFTEHAQGVIAFLQRAMDARRRADSMSDAVYDARHPDRMLRLSLPELGDLLDMHVGTSFEFTNEVDEPGVRRVVTVSESDPDVAISIVDTLDEGYELIRKRKILFVSCGGRLYAWDGDEFHKCSARLEQVSDFLVGVYSNPVEQLFVGKEDARRFAMTALAALGDDIVRGMPQELAAMRPMPCKLSFFLDRTKEGATCVVRANYGETSVDILPASDAGDDGLLHDARTESRGIQIVRRYFSSLGPVVSEKGLPLPCIPDEDSTALARLLVEGLPELHRLGNVFATHDFERLTCARKPRVSVGLSIKSNLVNVSLSASDVDPEELSALLESYHQHRRFHRMRDGSFVDLGTLDLSEADRVVEELGLTSSQIASGGVSVPVYQAFLLDDIVAEEAKDASFNALVENFKSVDPTTYEVPPTLNGSLRPYQVSGYQWLCSLADMGFGGILADEMGLGKTVQLISFILHGEEAAREVGPSLIVCPASLVYNWMAEFERFAPGLHVAAVGGSKLDRAVVRRGSGYDVLVTSYDLLRRDAEDYARMEFWCVALDEAQYIKNHATLAARSVKRIKARHRFALTGTPVENRLSEMWSIFDFLMPGMLGPYARFRERYEQPILEGDSRTAQHLRSAIGPFVMRRLKSNVLVDLPEKLEGVVYAKMEGEQQKIYLAHEQRILNTLGQMPDAPLGRDRLALLAELMRLRQVCCDPRLVYADYEGPSAKLETIMDLVEQVMDSGAKALIFSQFTSYLDLIAERLTEAGVRYYVINGSTPKKTRVELVDAFNADETPVFLISLKAGGTGLNLIGASVVIHADPWWNAAAQNQATDRAHRIGQTRDVSVYKVIAKDTVEERILRLQDAKDDLARQILSGEGTSLAQLTREDLMELLGS